MFIFWPWIGIIAAVTLITAVMTLKLARRCGVRMTPLTERSVTSYQEDQENNFEVMEDGTINYNLQDFGQGGEYPQEAGYPPDMGYPPQEGVYRPQDEYLDYGPGADYPAQPAPRQQSSRQEYSL